MKKILYTALIGALFAASGCQGLDEVTYSSTQGKDFFKSRSQVQAACLNIYAVYSASGGWERWMHTTGTTQCKYMLSPNNAFNVYIMHTVDGSNADFYNLWNVYFRAINCANEVIAYAHRASAPESFIQQHIAEARFLRAFSYYQLTSLWGAVPLHLTPSETEDDIALPRSPVDRIMEAVQEDLAFAIEHLPVEWGFKGRATKKSAIFLMGKVMLHMTGKPLYRTDLYPAIIDAMQHMIWNPEMYDAALETNYGDVFSNTNKNGKEVLLTWSSERDSYGSQLPYLLLPLNSNQFYVTGSTGAAGLVGMSQALYDRFEATDTRRALLLRQYTQKPNVNGVIATPVYGTNAQYRVTQARGIGIGKYVDPNSTGNNSSVNDKIVYRFAEAYLIFAEAYNEIGQLDSAAFYLNKVRSRAQTSLIPVGPQEELRNAIRTERYLELYGEWSEIFDIRRLGEEAEHWRDSHYINDYFNPANPGSPIRNDIYDSKWDLFPIPTRELNYNGAITSNNPGW